MNYWTASLTCRNGALRLWQGKLRRCSHRRSQSGSQARGHFADTTGPEDVWASSVSLLMPRAPVLPSPGEQPNSTYDQLSGCVSRGRTCPLCAAFGRLSHCEVESGLNQEVEQAHSASRAAVTELPSQFATKTRVPSAAMAAGPSKLEPGTPPALARLRSRVPSWWDRGRCGSAHTS
jgi:hypothetical protein